MKFDSPQPAPWSIGTKLQYQGDSISGFVNEGGDTIWHKKGIIYTVVDVKSSLGSDRVIDENGETYTQYYHGWSVLQSELDPDRKHGKGIDVDSMHEYEILK